VDLDLWMERALAEARAAAKHDDVPVGAVIVDIDTEEVIAARHNERELTSDTTAHAELLAIRDAAAVVGSWRLARHALVVTLEPCPMCAGAAWAARIPIVVFGAADPKAGAAGTLYNFAADPRLNHNAEVVRGVNAEECAELLEAFFRTRRQA